MHTRGGRINVDVNTCLSANNNLLALAMGGAGEGHVAPGRGDGRGGWEGKEPPPGPTYVATAIDVDHVDCVPTPVGRRGGQWRDNGMREGVGPGPDIRRPVLLAHAPLCLRNPGGDALSSRDSAVPAGSRRRLVQGERAGGGGCRGQRAPPQPAQAVRRVVRNVWEVKAGGVGGIGGAACRA